MTRAYQINGECLVEVKGGAHQSGNAIGDRTELGLASEQVIIRPRFVHADVHVDDFGPDIPPEVLCMLAEVQLSMTLIHYDKDALQVCIEESLGQFSSPATVDGVIGPAGSPLGNGRPRLASGCHYISVNLTSPVLNYPWRFRTCYLADRPVEIPLGTHTSLVNLNWRCIPYRPSSSGVEISSSGAVLWDHSRDSLRAVLNGG